MQPDRSAAGAPTTEPASDPPVRDIETVMCAYYDPSCIETRELAGAAARVQDWIDALQASGDTP